MAGCVCAVLSFSTLRSSRIRLFARSRAARASSKSPTGAGPRRLSSSWQTLLFYRVGQALHLIDDAVGLACRVRGNAGTQPFLACRLHVSDDSVALLLQGGYIIRLQRAPRCRRASPQLEAHIFEVAALLAGSLWNLRAGLAERKQKKTKGIIISLRLRLPTRPPRP